MKITATLQSFGKNSLGYETHFPIPNEFALDFIEGKNRRVICDYGNGLKVHSALTHDGIGGFYVLINKQVKKKLGIDLLQEFTFDISKDTSKYGMYCPPSFVELMEQDPDGALLFENLTPGAKRSLLHIIGKLKSEPKQIEKGFITLEYLKEVNGKLDFKELQQAFKSRKWV